MLEFDCQFNYADSFTLDVAFNAGACVTALFGPSGCGKTTTIMLIAGLLDPNFGSIRLEGNTLFDSDKRIAMSPRERQVGIVFQDHRLFPHKSVEGNLRYGLNRTSNRDIEFSEVVDVLELRELLGRKPSEISGGQKQRVALGRAILSGPRMLLLDEPLDGLDQPLREKLVGYLQQIVDRWRVAILLVSHDQAIVRRLADHVVVIEQGRVVDSGPTQATLDQATLKGMVTHPGPVNLLKLRDASVHGDHIQGSIGSQLVFVPAHVPGGKLESDLYVQFAPADVTLSRELIVGLSMRNQLEGVIRDVVSLPDGSVYVAVDVGQIIWAQVTPQARQELGLEVDQRVYTLIKASSLEVI